MSKVLPASCAAGVVLAGVPPLPLPAATVLSEGVGPSEGIAILDEDTVFYVPDTTPDLKATLDSLVNVLTQVKAALDKAVSALTTIDSKPTGGTGSAPTPAATVDIAAITTAATAIDGLKTTLSTLKGALR